jgi:hypothetical protein
MTGSAEYELAVNMSYTIIVSAGVDGPVLTLLDMPIAPEGQASVSATHFATLAGEVDLWEVNTGTALFTDLAQGSTAEAISVDPMSVKIGADLDNDMVVDASFFAFDVEAGDNVSVVAVDNVTADGVELVIASVDAEGNSSIAISGVIPPAPEPTNALAETTLPYLVSCENGEDGSETSPSFRVFSAPGATSIDFVVTSNMEAKSNGVDCWDTLFVYDAGWDEVYSGCVEDDGIVPISVPGDLAIFTVVSDPYSGLSSYQIDSYTANMP